MDKVVDRVAEHACRRIAGYLLERRRGVTDDAISFFEKTKSELFSIKVRKRASPVSSQRVGIRSITGSARCSDMIANRYLKAPESTSLYGKCRPKIDVMLRSGVAGSGGASRTRPRQNREISAGNHVRFRADAEAARQSSNRSADSGRE